jgi:hypothetical protein
MRLSVLAVSLILLFSPSIQAQHSAGGGGGSSGGGGGGGHSGGGGGGSSSGGSSHGGGSGSHGSGSSGSAHSGTSSHGAASAQGAAKTGVAHEGGALAGEARASYYSSVPGDSPAVRDPLLDEALAGIRIEVPAGGKVEQPVRAEIEKRGSEANKRNKAEPALTIRFPKHCHGRKCVAPPPTCAPGNRITSCRPTQWRLSEDMYESIHNQCGNLAQRLAREESRAGALRDRREKACSAGSVSPECAAATGSVARSDSRIARLRDQYQRCVFSDFRNTAAVSVSQR